METSIDSSSLLGLNSPEEQNKGDTERARHLQMPAIKQSALGEKDFR